MKRLITLVLLFFSLHQLNALDYYWIGGDGNFNDPQKWALGSLNGPLASQAPISTDNVYFEANSINNAASNIITFNSNSNCHHFWVDTAVSSSAGLIFISSSNQTLDIYGSLQLGANISFNFSGVLRFRSIKNGTETIYTANIPLLVKHIEFDGSLHTEWLLLDQLMVDDEQMLSDNWDWSIPTGSIVLYNGTINTNKQTVITDFFYSKNNASSRGMLLDSSTIILRGYNGGNAKAWWIDFNANLSNFNVFSASGTHFVFNQTAGKKQYGFWGIGMQYDSITSNNVLSIGGYTEYAYLKTNNSTYFVDAQISIDKLHLSSKHEHYFNSNNLVNNDFLEVDSFYSPVHCSDYITLRGFAKSTGLIRKKTPGQLTLNRVILQDMICDTSGGKSYLVQNGIDGGGNSAAWIFQTPVIKKMRFVDSGTQQWSDPNNWQLWNGSNWGANVLNCIPTPFIDVYIDDNSFPLGNTTIDIDVVANCRNIHWSASTINGASLLVNHSIHVFGSAIFPSNVGTFTMHQPIYFHGINDSLTSSGVHFNEIIFWKHSNYTIMDDLNATKMHGWLYSTINCSNITINTTILSLGNRVFNNVTFNLGGTFYDFGATVVTYNGYTTFNFPATSGFIDIRTQKEYAYSNSVYLPNVKSHGVKLQFIAIETFVMGDLELLGGAEFRGNNMQVTGSMTNYQGKVRLSKGNIYEIKHLSIADTLIGQGTCNEIITFRPYGTGIGNINMGATQVEFCFIQGIHNTGTPIQTASCIDGGNNAGWNFIVGTGTTYYWRASALNALDYRGDWSDPNHWTTNPNALTGDLGGCMPTLADTVIFDSLSFSTSSNGCHIDKTAFCKTLLCLADITVTGAELYVGQSFFLYPNMTNYDQEGVIYFVGGGSNHINLNGTTLKNCGVVFNNPAGEWILDEDFYLHDSVHRCYTGFVLDGGTFRTNGHELKIRSRFRADRTSNYRVLDIRNSTVNLLCNDRYNSYYGLTWDISNSVGMQILSTNSTLNFLNNTSGYVFKKYFYMGDGLTYDEVNFLDNNDDMYVYNDAIYRYAYFDGTTTIYGSNMFDSLALTGGYHWYIYKGKTQTLAPEHGKIISYGNASDFVYIESTAAGQDAYIHKEYGHAFCLDYVKIKDIQATKGLADPVNPSRHLALFFETGVSSDNINNSAQGIWAFHLPPTVTVNATHDTLVKFCNGGTSQTVPITFTGTYPYSVIINWNDDLGASGSDTLYFQDDDDDVTTPCQHFMDFNFTTNTFCALDIAGMRCGERDFYAPTSHIYFLLEKDILVDQNSSGTCQLTNKNHFTHFFDRQTTKPILSLQDQVNLMDTTALGQVEVKTYFDANVPQWNNLPYLQRHWLIEANNTGESKIRLYFTQAELDALSTAYNGTTALDLQTAIFLLRFKDTIGVGSPDTIPFTPISLVGEAAIPFSAVNGVLAIEFESNSLGAFMIQIKPRTILFPLNLLSFTVQKETNYSAKISWTTALEKDIKEYVVEHSSNAIDFVPINKQTAQLLLENYYEQWDHKPFVSTTYYRLKIIKQDGSSFYSPIKTISFEEAINDIEIFPNPTCQDVQVTINSNIQQLVWIKLYNLRGELIDSEPIQLDVGRSTKSLSLGDKPSGTYFIRMIGKDGQLLMQELVVKT